MPDLPDQPEQLPYAVPSPSYSHKLWASAAIVFSAIAIAVVGGCFLIGVMLITNHGFNNTATAILTTGATILVFVLYILAFACFVVAAFILFKGLAGLFRVLRG